MSETFVSASLEGANPIAVNATPQIEVNATPQVDGSYEFKDLLAGNYTIEVFTKDPKLVERTRLRAFVSNSGATTADVVIEPAGAISGWLELEDGTRLKQVKDLFVGAIIEQRQVAGNITNDGSFTIPRLPGGSVKLWAQAGNSKYYVRRIIHGRDELADGMLSLEAGERLSGVRVVLSDQGARLHGLVSRAGERGPAVGAWVIIIPEEKERRGSIVANRTARADQRGYFVIEGIEAGRYYVLAYRDAQSVKDNLPTLERWLVEHQTAVSVIEAKSGAQQELRLTVLE